MKYLKDLSEELRQELVNFELFRNSVLQYSPTGNLQQKFKNNLFEEANAILADGLILYDKMQDQLDETIN